MNYIVLIPTDYINARQVADETNNMTFVSITAVREYLETQLKKEDEEDEIEGEILIYDLGEFVNEVNDQTLDVLTCDFITYVNLED